MGTWVCEPNTEFGNEADTRTESYSAALRERHMGDRRRRRPTLPTQRRVGVARQPMTVPLLINHLDRSLVTSETSRTLRNSLYLAGQVASLPMQICFISTLGSL